MKAFRVFACIVATALITGCGGSGSPSNPIQSAMPPVAGSRTANVTFSISVPAKTVARRPAYVSPSTQSASVTVTPSGGSAGTPVVVNCTSVCSGTVSAPVGSDIFAAHLYSGTNGGGSLLSTGSLTQSIVANRANTVTMTFNGVVASIAVSLPTIAPGAAGSAAVTVKALDASGNTIVGPGTYVDANGNPMTISLGDSDTSGNSSLSQSTITQPGSSVTLNYTASFDTNPTITARSSSASVATASTVVAFPAPTLSALQKWSATAGSTFTQTLTGTNFVAGSATVSSGAGVTVTGVNVTSATTLTATFTVAAGATFGTQGVTVTTNNGTSGAQPFAIANGSTLTVTTFTDANAGSPAGTGSGASGDLRSAILAANAAPGSAIVFSGCTPAAPCSIALSGALPPIAANTVIDGGAYGSVIVSGQNLYRAFWVSAGTVILANMEIADANATGGSGGNGTGNDGGGGGAGLGAGLFISGGNVTLVNDFFSANTVLGGNGGIANGSGARGWGDAGAGGGGGLGGNGGSANLSSGGGGGLLGTGQPGSSSSGGNGGGGFAGGGGSGSTSAAGSAGGFGGGGGGAFYALSGPAIGGAGGFGGGGGGGEGAGGAAGFGGGGGGVDFGNGTNGGPGGGSSGCSSATFTPGLGGALSTTLSGGSGDTTGNGGGGAAAGPAILVYAGTLTTLNSGATGSHATGGAGGGGSATAGAADATPVFNYGGTVNGVALFAGSGGPVPSALGTLVP